MAKRIISTTPMRPCAICGKPVAGDRGERIHQTRGNGKYCQPPEEPKESKAKGETSEIVHPRNVSINYRNIEAAAAFIESAGSIDLAVSVLGLIKSSRGAIRGMANLL